MMLKEKDLIFFDDKEKFLKILKSKLPSKKYNKELIGLIIIRNYYFCNPDL